LGDCICSDHKRRLGPLALRERTTKGDRYNAPPRSPAAPPPSTTLPSGGNLEEKRRATDHTLDVKKTREGTRLLVRRFRCSLPSVARVDELSETYSVNMLCVLSRNPVPNSGQNRRFENCKKCETAGGGRKTFCCAPLSCSCSSPPPLLSLSSPDLHFWGRTTFEIRTESFRHSQL